ncbi:flagellar hook-associated protein 3 [Sphingomonas sanguinis]|uniref:Flagellin n=1 Tax=Sphingomonas sanguinis TaxID=33051 RepID=A0ABU5LUQ4_9SPHN|nr:flagellin [Sphingomonas sanguinis]MDZ7283664.1 flagellin [Sphingomonas sanguinis]QXT35024.1 flagellar hook-associated protein 3 [Sphingomonas sanguinis]
MQISTSVFYDTAARRMTALTGKANALQVQISTGKKLTNPSDDAAAAAQVAEFDRRDADDAVYKTNLTLAGSLLQQADTTLGQIGNQVQKALELTTQAANGTLTAANRASVGDQIASIRDALLGLANSKDSRGLPLFGAGAGSDAVTMSGGSYTYTNSTANVSDIPIADGQSVDVSVSAERVFKAGDNDDTLNVLNRLVTALKSGGDASATISDAMDKLKAANDNVSTVQASVGAREARVELQQGLQKAASTDRAQLRSSIEDADPVETITQLQQTMTVLQATQSSFTKLTSLSLFDYLK